MLKEALFHLHTYSTYETPRGEPGSVCVHRIAIFEHRPNTIQFWLSFDLHKKKLQMKFSEIV